MKNSWPNPLSKNQIFLKIPFLVKPRTFQSVCVNFSDLKIPSIFTCGPCKHYIPNTVTEPPPACTIPCWQAEPIDLNSFFDTQIWPSAQSYWKYDSSDQITGQFIHGPMVMFFIPGECWVFCIYQYFNTCELYCITKVYNFWNWFYIHANTYTHTHTCVSIRSYILLYSLNFVRIWILCLVKICWISPLNYLLANNIWARSNSGHHI